MAAQSKKVFVESDILYSFINRADQRYPQASAFFRYFAEQKFQVFTSYPCYNKAFPFVLYNYDLIPYNMFRCIEQLLCPVLSCVLPSQSSVFLGNCLISTTMLLLRECVTGGQ